MRNTFDRERQVNRGEKKWFQDPLSSGLRGPCNCSSFTGEEAL